MRRAFQFAWKSLRLAALFISTTLLLAAVASWTIGSYRPLGFTLSDRGIENRLYWAGNERTNLMFTLDRGWFCATLRYHTKPYPVPDWTCGGPLAESFDTRRDVTICPRVRYSGWPMPISGEWKLHKYFDVEIANYRICQTDGTSTRIFDVSNHAGWLEARNFSALAVPDQLRRHYEIWLAVPIWSLVIFVGLPPATFAIRRLAVRRMRGPLDCRNCGYNLTGNASGICPECGTPAKAI